MGGQGRLSESRGTRGDERGRGYRGLRLFLVYWPEESAFSCLHSAPESLSKLAEDAAWGGGGCCGTAGWQAEPSHAFGAVVTLRVRNTVQWGSHPTPAVTKPQISCKHSQVP